MFFPTPYSLFPTPCSRFPIPYSLLSTLLFLLCLFHPLPAAAGNDPRPNDSIEVALTFGDLSAVPFPNLTPAPVWQTGLEREFNVLDVTTGIMNVCTARVFQITDNIVFWLDTRSQDMIPGDITDRLFRFDAQTLPQLRKTFGEEANPGIDNDPRFHVVFTDLISEAYNGYFSAENSADPRISKTSNGMELLFLNTSLLNRGADAVINTLSHEFQHMVHHHCDPNELSFINEGLSGLAEYVALQDIRDSFIRAYLNDTGRSLIWWSESGTNAPYYGSSFLFSMYLYDRFGEDLIRELVKIPENGLTSLDQALQHSGFSFTADDVFQQWSAALLAQLLQTPVREWDYRSYAFPQDGIYRDVRPLKCGVSELHETAQYGLRMYSSSCEGPFRVTVAGSTESPVTALNIPGGNSAWWGGAVNNSMALLSRTFELNNASAPVSFEYDANFSIENGYDYYYLLLTDAQGRVSRLSPSTVTAADPAGQNLGGGTTGRSYGTVHESIDLSPWIGQQVRLTFVYLTDTAGLGDGLLLDNFRIAAIGFTDNAETDDGGWQAEGFSRISASVPQRYSLVILHPQNDGAMTAEFAEFDGGEPFSIDCPEGACSFAVSPVNRDIRSRAAFSVLTEPLSR